MFVMIEVLFKSLQENKDIRIHSSLSVFMQTNAIGRAPYVLYDAYYW